MPLAQGVPGRDGEASRSYNSHLNLMRRVPRPLQALLLAVVLVAGGYGAFWFYTEKLVRNGLADWATARRAEGYNIAYGEPVISGFPLRIKVTLNHPTISGPSRRWRWRGDGVVAETRPWAFRNVIVRALGQQTINFPRGAVNDEVTASSTEAVGRLSLSRTGRLAQAIFDADGVTITTPGMPGPIVTQHGHLEIAVPQGPVSAGTKPAVTAATKLRLQDIALPAAVAGPLGPQLRWITAEGQLLGPFGPGSPAKALAAWRDAGGTLELKNFDLAWGPLQISGNATVALDIALQPEGAGTCELRGYAETVDALIAQGLVKPHNGALVKAGLGLLAKTPADGGPKVLTVPLSIQKQVLYVGPIGLLHISTIKWAE